MDWKQFERRLFDAWELAFRQWLADHPNQHVYALAFHEGYREIDEVIRLPWLAVNSLEALQELQGTEDVELQWNPTDWRWPNIDAVDATSVDDLETELNDEANRGSQKQWLATEKRFLSVMVRISKALRKEFASNAQTTKEIVVYLSEEVSDFDTLKRCVPKRLFDKYFADLDPKPAIAPPSSTTELMQRYLEAPWNYKEEILQLGDSAIDPLIAYLDEQHGHFAAGLLGQLGHGNPKVITVLRSSIQEKPRVAGACANALFDLGDKEFLITLIDDPDACPHIVRAITRGLKQFEHHRLDYRLVERFLNDGSEEVKVMIVDEIKPGSSFDDIQVADIDEVLRGLTSEHLAIRQHAVMLMACRGLGSKAGKRLLPELAKQLQDDNANIRRLALLSLKGWKSAAKPYRDQMWALKEDPDRKVRMTATYVFE
ncbi:DUF4303 domain-containing protein [Novipirellula herctigrandis]|uniref:DUF4303 domain-containing protein n=1 Tax=Novipirellula herctigrandis TaxID=2527986 RepID=UPI003AF3C5B2